MITTHRAGASTPTAPRNGSRARRTAEGLAFVGTWVALGYALRLDSEAYLLLGIPLTAVFQLAVRRRPLRELWVRDGAPARRAGWRDAVAFVLLAAAPAFWGLQVAASGRPAVVAWYVAALGGAAAAAYALRHTSPMRALRAAALPTAVGVAGNLIVVGGFQIVTGAGVEVADLAVTIAKWLAIYLPATFVVEEVAFRGALDAHLHHPGEDRGRLSAVVVSALWGLWHLPVATGMPLPLLVVSLLAWHIAVGIPLSLAWRRSGNLAGPAFAHAAMDAVRNALLGLR